MPDRRVNPDPSSRTAPRTSRVGRSGSDNVRGATRIDNTIVSTTNRQLICDMQHLDLVAGHLTEASSTREYRGIENGPEPGTWLVSSTLSTTAVSAGHRWPDDVVDLLDEPLIVTEREPMGAIGLALEGMPDPADRRLRQPVRSATQA